MTLGCSAEPQCSRRKGYSGNISPPLRSVWEGTVRLSPRQELASRAVYLARAGPLDAEMLDVFTTRTG